MQCFDDLLDNIAVSHPNDTDMIPYFADLWASANSLAAHLARSCHTLDGKSVLELGCGAGLPCIANTMRNGLP